ncbi:MAG: GNAT family N-acetyltransferase [Actinomycetota bacterium]
MDEGECFVASSGDAVHGYALFGPFLHGHGFLRVIAVHPERRRQGAAGALVRHLDTLCPTDRLFTATEESNPIMQKVCEALGFEPAGFIDGLEEGERELIYMKGLKPGGPEGTVA